MDKIEQKVIAAAKEYYGEEDVAVVRARITEEWGAEGLRGYGIFTNDLGCGDVKYIARLDDFEVYDSDIEAAKQAAKDGIKMIPYAEQPKFDDYKYYRFLDTPTNRKRLAKAKPGRDLYL
jgi:hypothetical protein